MDPPVGAYSRGDMLHHHNQSPMHFNGLGTKADATAAARDQQQQVLTGQFSVDLPITYMPFKFENRRVRIDWRLLHGVDTNKLVRDTDLDTLEQLVTCLTWGDLEAEDTRHLSEGNFVKVFRLAQLLLEYLLYVQENLKHTNTVLDKSRAAAVMQAQSLDTRCRTLYSQLKHCKRELKRAHKTVKTFELMAAAVGGAAAAQAAAQAATGGAAAVAAAAAASTMVQQQQQQQPQPSQSAAPQQVSRQSDAVMTSGELLLQSQLTELTERLTMAVCEAERLRDERQELQYQIRHLHDTLAAKLGGMRSSMSSSGGGSRGQEAAVAAAAAEATQQQQQLFMAELQCAQAQLAEAQEANKELRQQLKQQSLTAVSAAESHVATLTAQVEEQGAELARLQAELCEKEASIKVFQTTTAGLQQQLDSLQRQLTSPEATTPSFVAKQRQQLAAAESAHAELQSENKQLKSEVVGLRLALEAAGHASKSQEALEEQEDDPLAAAEKLLHGDGDSSAGKARDWKVQEIERLQQESQQLQAKVASLQDRVLELEQLSSQLERQLSKARAAEGLRASQEASAAAAAGVVSSANAENAGSGWASVNSSGPRAELTAADLPDAGAVSSTTPVTAVTEHVGDVMKGQQDAKAAAGGSEGPKQLGGKVVLAGAGTISQEDGANSEGRIAAYRPDGTATADHDAAAAALEAPSSSPAAAGAAAAEPAVTQQHPGSSGTRGSIDQAAAQQLHALVAQLSAELSPEQLSAEYAEVCSDWDKPFDLTEEEKAGFRQLLPVEVDGLAGVLAAERHTPEEITSNKPRLLAGINRQLDAQLASYGIHPGRAGLSNVELLAAMKMLGERRAQQEAQLTPEQQEQVEVTRLGLMLHPYHALQTVLQRQPDDAAGKRHLPPMQPALLSAVRPPASMLPTPPRPVRLHPQQHQPKGLGAMGLSPAGTAPVALHPVSMGPNRATPSPSASARYSAASGYDSESEDAGGHSPVKPQQLHSTFTYQAAAGASISSPSGTAALGAGRASSPLSSEAARESISKATAGASFSPMSAALHAKHQVLQLQPQPGRIPGSPGSSSTTGPSGSPGAGSLSPLGRAAASAPGTQQQKQQQQQQQQMPHVGASAPVTSPKANMVTAAMPSSRPAQQQQHPASAAAALASKQYLNSSFDDSDEF